MAALLPTSRISDLHPTPCSWQCRESGGKPRSFPILNGVGCCLEAASRSSRVAQPEFLLTASTVVCRSAEWLTVLKLSILIWELPAYREQTGSVPLTTSVVPSGLASRHSCMPHNVTTSHSDYYIYSKVLLHIFCSTRVFRSVRACLYGQIKVMVSVNCVSSSWLLLPRPCSPPDRRRLLSLSRLPPGLL